MPRIALGLEYDGCHFHGWQRQNTVISVQSVIEDALTEIAREPIQTICAGRTDAGVHASGQVIHFDTHACRQEKAWVFGTNTKLPPTVRVLWAQEVSESFSARYSATGRRYRYVIYNHPLRPSLFRQYVCWHYRKLDVQKMIEASQYWLGTHDFTSFRASGCQSRSPIRSLYSLNVVRIGEQVIIDFFANAFLHHMVRNMVGVLLKIGAGFNPPVWAKKVLEAKDRRAAGMTAQASGLYLIEVQYPRELGLPEKGSGTWFLKTHEESH